MDERRPLILHPNTVRGLRRAGFEPPRHVEPDFMPLDVIDRLVKEALWRQVAPGERRAEVHRRAAQDAVTLDWLRRSPHA